MNRRNSNRRNAVAWSGFATAFGLAFAVSVPAQAENYFGAGFEDEVGRIAAHAVVGVGVGLFHHAVAPGYVEYREVATVHYRPHPRRHARAHYKQHRKHAKRHYRKARRGHDRHYRGDHYRGDHYRRDHYRGGPPCAADHYANVDRHRRHGRRH